MVSKTQPATTTLLAALFLLAGCASRLPWADEKPGETNAVFHTENNVIVMDSVQIEHHAGKFLFSTSLQRTAVSLPFRTALGTPGPRGYSVQFGHKATIWMAPATVDLRGAADAVLGVDSWIAPVVSIDYRNGLISFEKTPLVHDDMVVSPYDGPPSVTVHVEGQPVQAIVDTSSPDTLVLPLSYGSPGRRRVAVAIGGVSFGLVDVRFSDVTDARVGNRLLSKFLVLIDQSRHQVGLWRDPRTPAGV
jgi:hypothetical protein